jgi:hypothetical protein
LVAESTRAARRAQRRHREPAARGGRVGGCHSWAAQRRPIGGGGHGDLLENGEAAAQTRAEHTTDSQLADRPPDSPHRHAGSCRTSGRPRPRRTFRSRAPNPRSWPCRGCRPCGWDLWTLVGGRRQLLRLLGVDVRSCNQQRSHRGWRRPFPTRGAKVGVDAYTGEVSRPDVLGGLIHGARRHSLTN